MTSDIFSGSDKSIYSKEVQKAWSKGRNVLIGVSKNTGIPKWMIYNGKPY